MDPDEEAKKILTTAEELLVLGKIRESLEQAQIARDYYLESGGCLKKMGVSPEKSMVLVLLFLVRMGGIGIMGPIIILF